MRAIAVVLAVVVLVLLAWGAGEAHYQSCVSRAEATTPEIARQPGGYFLDPNRAAPSNRARLGAVNGCSRLPF